MSNRRSAPVPVTGDASRDIGGAIVRRRITLGGRILTNGTVLTASEVLAMPKNNFNALRDNGYLSVFPKAIRTHLEAAPEATEEEVHVVNTGFGRYNVIVGTIKNAFPLTRDQANALATQLTPATPEPAAVVPAAVVPGEGTAITVTEPLPQN